MKTIEDIKISMEYHKKAAIENSDNLSVYNYHLGAYGALAAIIADEEVA